MRLFGKIPVTENGMIAASAVGAGVLAGVVVAAATLWFRTDSEEHAIACVKDLGATLKAIQGESIVVQQSTEYKER